jgi:hypothetical protein
MSLLSSPPSLSSNSILCLAVDGQQPGTSAGSSDEMLNCGRTSSRQALRHVGTIAIIQPTVIRGTGILQKVIFGNQPGELSCVSGKHHYLLSGSSAVATHQINS